MNKLSLRIWNILKTTGMKRDEAINIIPAIKQLIIEEGKAFVVLFFFIGLLLGATIGTFLILVIKVLF